MNRNSISIIVLFATVSFSFALSPASDHYPKNSFGFGLGIPYGGLGMNLDYHLLMNACITGGVGFRPVSGRGYGIGLRQFVLGSDRVFRPKLSVFYGSNVIVRHNDRSYSYEGISIGIGFQLMWGRNRSHGVDFDMVSAVTVNWDEEELEAQGVDLDEMRDYVYSLGYRFGF